MNDEHFGSCLRRAREARALTLGDVSAAIKVPRSALERLESGTLAGLPAHVFVRGFIRSYAKAVGLAESTPLGLFDRAVGVREEAARLEAQVPVVDPVLAGVVPGPVPEPHSDHHADYEESGRRRGLGIAVFVLILVLIATITLSLLLRRPPQSGEGLSIRRPAAGASFAAAPDAARDRFAQG
jgi:cytoskeletal protein RodZ